MTNRVKFLVSACVATVAASVVIAGCGILGAPVAVGSAIGTNTSLGLKGTVVDGDGKTLDNVIIEYNKDREVWSALAGTKTTSENKTFIAKNGRFDVPDERGYSLYLGFSRGGGYQRQSLRQTKTGGIEFATAWGNRWPLGTEALVTLLPHGAYLVEPQRASVDITYSEWPKQQGVDFGALSKWPLSMKRVQLDQPPTSPADANANIFYVDLVPGEVKTKRGNEIADVYELNVPAMLTLKLNGPGNGFVRYRPKVGTDPFAQMREAPETGYADVVLNKQRLLEMRKNAGNVILGAEFFYVKIGGKYGKAAVTWRDSQPTATPDLNLTYTFAIEENGSRTLTRSATR